MKQNYKSKLNVNKKEIDMNPLVEDFVSHVSVGIVNSLKGVDYLKTVEIHLDKSEVKIKVNGEEIKVTPFPNDFIANTIRGLVSSLKGVDEITTVSVKVDIY